MNNRNNFSKIIVCSVFAIGFLSFLKLNSYTNKTFLRQLDHSYINPTENFVSFAQKQDNQFHARSDFGFSLFYYQSTNGAALGRYFGCNETNNVELSAKNSNEMDVYQAYLIHSAYDVEDRVAKVDFRPKTTRMGIDLFYIYDFSKFVKNLYFKINLPIEHLKNDLRYDFHSSGYEEDDDSKVVLKYLKGDYSNSTDLNDLQSSLKKAKISGKESKTGVADLDLILGYKFLNAFFTAGLIVPTGNKPDGHHLFQPIVGQDKHWAMKFGIESQFVCYESKKFDISFFFDVDYKYFFENSQDRILSIKGANWGQYYLLGKNGDMAKSLTPAANLLTRDVKVRAGSQLNGNIGFLFNVSKFNIDLGYDFLFREDEKVKLKSLFNKDTYAVALDAYDTSDAFDSNALDSGYNSNWLNGKFIDTTVAQSPFVLAHKLYADLGYSFKISKLETHVQFGAFYNFVNQNSNTQGWGLNFNTNLYF